MAFKVGDRVFWVSQAAGISRRKEGEVIEVVTSGAYPKSRLSAKPGHSRDHESYVVKAKAIGTQTENTKVYWPLVTHLQPMPPQEKSFEEACTEAGAKSIAEAEDKAAVAGFDQIVADISDPANHHELPPDGSYPTAHTINAEFVEKLEASDPPREASGAKFIIGVDMAKDDVASTMVYSILDEATGCLRVASKEEYEAFLEKSKNTPTTKTPLELALEDKVIAMSSSKDDE